VGLAVLGNGGALLAHIILGIDLSMVLLGLWAAGLLAIVAVIVASDPKGRRAILGGILVGSVAGLLATVTYDLSKALLSQLDPAPWNPFEAVHVFGMALLGPSAPDGVVRVAGWAFHLTTGTTFGIAFTFLFERWTQRGLGRSVLLGIGWGLFLETFQLILYPGWLNIRFVDEFRQVSFGAHAVFGAVLGLLVPTGLRRLR
jgi:hypothetical protein